MKNRSTCFAILLLLFLSSCLKEADETILVNDPQRIPFITDDRWPSELLELFGEENVNFGDTPPRLECEFKSNHQYVATNLPDGESPSIGSITPVIHYHKFCNPYLQICKYHSMNSGENTEHIIDTVYIIGYEKKFTAYYLETWTTIGRPTLAVVMSGELADEGIVNYGYGYQIVSYADDHIPATVYPINSVFIFQDPDHLSEYSPWTGR